MVAEVPGSDSQAELRGFAYEYLRVFGSEVARSLAAAVKVSSTDRLRRAVEDAEAAGCDELILVPGTVDPACLEATVAALAG